MASPAMLASELRDLVGPDYVNTDADALAKAAVEGVTAAAIVRPGDVDTVADVLAWANEAGLAVIPRGAGTTLDLGEPPVRADIILALDRLNRVLEYEPADLTVSVEAGVKLGELQRILGERGQWLPLDPPLGAERTIGGIVATAASGPHRWGYGTPRDLLIGLQVVEADGLVFRGGAKVVKNVAGYDLPKLFVGSLGTLGVIVEATFKLQPLPRAWGSLIIRADAIAPAARLVGQVITSPLTPAALSLLDAGAARLLLSEVGDIAPPDTAALLLVRFGGIGPAVARQQAELQALAERAGCVVTAPDDNHELWRMVADLPRWMTPSRAMRLKSAVLPTRLADAFLAGHMAAQQHDLALGQVAHAGHGVVYAVLRSYGDDASQHARMTTAGQDIRRAVAALGGTTVVEHAPLPVKAAVGVWGAARSDFRLMQALKDQFDPRGTLNPGRFVGGI